MNALASALVAAQKEMPVVPKSARANYGTYAPLDSIIDKTLKVLNKHGLAISQFPAETSTGAPGLRTVLLHSSGESLEATVPLLLNGKHDMQALGGAITYARRYGWASVLGIANDEDDDGDRVSSSAPADGTSGRGKPGAVESGEAATPPTPAPGSPAEFVWSSGKHQGKSLSETPRSYIEWYAQQGPKEDVRTICNEYLVEGELVTAGATQSSYYDNTSGADSDIPFAPTVDGIQ